MPGTPETFKAAIDRNDITFLREYLDQNPEMLDAKLKWGGTFEGFALNYAAYRDLPLVIDFLVTEKKVSIDRQWDIGAEWTALHHAQKANAYMAAAALLSHGANVRLKDNGGKTNEIFAASAPVQDILRSGALDKLRVSQEGERERRITGTWTLTGEKEVVHDYEQPGSRQRLTDTFNFETRIWRATARDMDGKGMVQNVIFFDDMPDRTILEGALAKLKELGGTAVDSDIDGGRIAKKTLRMPQPGQG